MAPISRRSAAAQATLCDLRRRIAKIEETVPQFGGSAGRDDESSEGDRDPWHGAANRPSGRSSRYGSPVSTGNDSLDEALGGGLPASGLVEIVSEQTREAASAAGLGLGLIRTSLGPGSTTPLLWIFAGLALNEAGMPHAPALAAQFGFEPARLMVAEAGKLADALWIAEEAARLSGPLAILLEIRGNPAAMDLTASRRLHLRSVHGRRPLILLRQAADAETSSAVLRLLAAPAPAAERLLPDGTHLAGSIAGPAFKITVDKSRTTPRLASLIVEWNSHDHRFLTRSVERAGLDHTPERIDEPAHRGAVVSPSFDRPAAAAGARSGLALRQTG